MDKKLHDKKTPRPTTKLPHLCHISVHSGRVSAAGGFSAEQGRRHNFKSGGTNITASEASRKFGGCTCHCSHATATPPLTLTQNVILGVQQLQREAYGEPIGQRCYNILR